MPLISIIIPVYNIEKFIKACVNSIIHQSFQDYELILINDGSKDNSGQICEDFKALHKNITVIHQKNQGVSAARNAGIAIALGKYILFVDGDDLIEDDMLETMVNTAENEECDLVVCGAKHVDEKDSFLFEELTGKGYRDRNGLLRSLFEMPNPLGGCIWNKLFLRHKIKDVLFVEGRTMAEDRLFLFDCYVHLDSCVKISESFYHVRERADSATHQRSTDQAFEMIKSSYELLMKAREYSSDLESYAFDKFLDDCLRYIPEIQENNSVKTKHNKHLIHCSKRLMLQTIIYAYFKKKLPVNKIRGYLKSLILF